MTAGWGGADPTGVIDAGDYELGTEYTALVDVTLTKIRVWAPANAAAFSGRTGTVWSTAGAVLATAALPTNLPSGWSSYDLAAPLGRAAGQRWVVSYTTGGNYGVVDHALDADVMSSDNSVTALANASATNGNGVFNTIPATFPTTANASHFFYGADVEFDLGLPGQTAPTITAVTLTAAGLDVVADITATDPEGLSGAVYTVEWGDGTSSVSSTPSLAHTYATAGLKAVLAKVTDSTAKTDYAAAAIDLLEPAAALDIAGVVDAVVSHALASGLFEAVNGHEPKHAPAGRGLTAAVWAQALAPVSSSGLAMTSGRLELTVRLFAPMLAEPADAIDPDMLRAVSTLLAAYSGDFDLGQQVRCVDLLGTHGTPLSARAGYLQQDEQELRVMDITVPLIINDIWAQAA